MNSAAGAAVSAAVAAAEAVSAAAVVVAVATVAAAVAVIVVVAAAIAAIAVATAAVVVATAATAASKPILQNAVLRPDVSSGLFCLLHRSNKTHESYRNRLRHSGFGSDVGRYSPNSA